MSGLDRTRPYGELWPPQDGAWYEQDGRRFRFDGTPVEAEAAAAPVATTEPVDAAPVDAPPVKTTRRKAG